MCWLYLDQILLAWWPPARTAPGHQAARSKPVDPTPGGGGVGPEMKLFMFPRFVRVSLSAFEHLAVTLH